VLVRVLGLVWLAALVAFVLVLTLRDSDDEEAGLAQVRAAALRWVGIGSAEAPRRDGNRWEVDVERPNGSLVEVEMNDQLQLRGIDEELGPHGTLARDELTGPARRRASDAALAVVGSGKVLSVERETKEKVEVRVQRRPDEMLEVQIQGGSVVGVEDEHPDDE
jgi:hypothetical protein